MERNRKEVQVNNQIKMFQVVLHLKSTPLIYNSLNLAWFNFVKYHCRLWLTDVIYIRSFGFSVIVHILLVEINVLFWYFLSAPFLLAILFIHYFSKHEVQPLEISLTSHCSHSLWRIEIIKLDFIHISYLFITSYTLIHPQRQVKVSQDFHKETFHLVPN